MDVNGHHLDGDWDMPFLVGFKDTKSQTRQVIPHFGKPINGKGVLFVSQNEVGKLTLDFALGEVCGWISALRARVKESHTLEWAKSCWPHMKSTLLPCKWLRSDQGDLTWINQIHTEAQSYFVV